MKKYLKLIGNVITAIAILFVIKKLFQTDIDYSLLLKKGNILPIVIAIIIITSIVILNCLPWRKLVYILSSVSIPFKEAVSVYTKSNILKYLPGNVFQYVGRNDLANRMGIRHTDVAFATALEIIMMVFSALLLSVVFLQGAVMEIFITYRDTFIMLVMIAFAVIILGTIVAILRFKDKFRAFLTRFFNIFKKKNILSLIGCVLYYVISTFILSLSYMIVLVFILKQDISTDIFVYICGAYILSWLIGFITPGAPAGIGIKEAVMMAITGEVLNQEAIVLSLVVLRVLTIFGDVMGFVIVQLVIKFVERKTI